ncbi:MAG: hypothetical protein GXY25_18095, partial [Pirellulaceae bacterium]|nr:hypothetical protein [Pirellulaceae bacterium]
QILQLASPQAQVSPGPEANQLIVWARPEDHVLIEQTLEQIDVEGPEEKQAKAVVYKLGISEIRRVFYVMQFLQNAVPAARLTLGQSTDEIIAWARPKDHEEIKKLVDEFVETPETAPKVMVYTLEKTTAASAMQLLASAFPMARFTPGSDPYQLIVWARGNEQPKIEAAIRDLSQKEPEETAPRMVIYPLTATTTTQATALLRLIVPQAQFGVGANTRQLVAWARPADHELIKKAVEEMGKEEPAETAPRVEVYTVETVDVQTAISVLLKTVPEAAVNAGSDARQLVALARPAEHEKIKATLDQLAKKGPEEKQPSIAVYPLGTASAAAAMQVLTPIVPQAKFTVGQDPSKLIAWAYPEDHATIKAAVDQIEADSWLDGNRVMSVYPMKPEDVTTLLSLLDPVIRQHAQFVPDAERQCLIVWSDKRYAAAIQRTVEEYTATVPPVVKPTAVVYRFEEADSLTAFNVVRTLVPEAMIAIDYRTGAIVATALPEDHEKIRSAIEEMNRDAIEKAPRLQVHRITSADPNNVLTTIQNLFRMERNVQFSLDAATDSLIAYASPLQHQKIDELIQEIEKGTTLDSALQLKLYSLKNVDAYAATEVLTDMFQKQGVRADLTVDRYRNQLVAMARSEQHAKIEEILEQFRTEERILEIFQLDYVELDTASLAIRRLFTDESYLSQPDVDPDPTSGQLMVRASAEQLEKVRQLLIRMGETGLTPTKRSSSGNLRVVPFKGNVQEVLKELQKVWPTLRTNEIRVVTPADIMVPVEPEAKTQESPEPEPQAAPPAEPQAGKADGRKPATAAATAEPAATAKPKAEPKTEAKAEPKTEPKTEAEVKPEPKP